MFQVMLRGSNGRIPTRGSTLAAGYDLYSSETATIPGGKRKLIGTEISIVPPPGTYGRIAPRSGLSVKGIDIGAGVVDADYRGELKILLINNSEYEFVINIGDRIAQIILEKHVVEDISVLKYMEETERNENGFGSTGV